MRRVTIALMGAVLATAGDRGNDETVYVFFSPSHPAPVTARAAAEHAQRKRLRPCLILEDLRHPAALTPEFAETVKVFTDRGLTIAIFDEEGLSLAKRFRIQKLPAVVVERGDRIHVVYGTDVRLKDLSD